jgi:cation transport protein ChaC
MWIFGYGSLMADKWEEKFGCVRRSLAVLRGYRRTFNKASTRNWGSLDTPCPTLNLEKADDGECKGVAFEFPDPRETAVREYLVAREGKGFPLESVTIRLEDGTDVPAYVPIYRGANLVSADETGKARIIEHARGMNGRCRSYIKGIAELLVSLDIEDPAVSSLWRAVQKGSFESLLLEIRERLKLLESSLPQRVDGYALSPDSKLPMKAMLYREALIWRMAELSRGALENLEKENLCVAVILIRAAVETTAGLWYLRAKLDDAVTNQSKGDIDDYLMKLLMGSKTVPELPQAINVLTFVDRVNKDIEGFREQYDNLSEFAHPNWAGTSLLYSKSDPKNLWTDFGKNIRGLDSTKQAGALNLSVALMIFEKTYSTIGELVPPFIELCKKRGQGAAPVT